MASGVVSDLDFIEELRLRRWARQHYVPAEHRQPSWHPFDLAKNVVNDTLHFALRVDTTKIPADLLKAYYQVELEALSASNPAGKPSARQKREARESARERLEEEAKDGRFLQRKPVYALW